MFLVLLFLFLQGGLSQNTLPGFKTTLSQDGLSYVASIGVKILEQSIGQISIADISGSAGSFVGNINWSLTNIVLEELGLDASEVKILPGSGIYLGINNVSCSLTLNWNYQQQNWPHVGGSGTAFVSVSQSYASLSLAFSVSDERPQVSVVSDSVTISNLQIQVQGGASWLYQFFINVLTGPITNAIEGPIESALASGINDGVNAALSTLPVDVPVNKLLEVDFGLINDPTFATSYVTVDDLGEFYSIQDPVECPSDVCALSASIPDTETNEMLQMIISDFVAQSAGFALFEAGMLNAVVTNQNIPPSTPVSLNTSYFVHILPNLYDFCPNCAVELQLNATAAPEISFSGAGASFLLNGNVAVVTIAENGTAEVAFVLSGNVSAEGDAILNGQLIYSNLTYQDSSFVVLKSNIGPIMGPLLNDLIALLLRNGLVPAVNEQLAVGLPLPTVQGVEFQSPSSAWGDHYLLISTDFTYDPSVFQTTKMVIL